MVIGWTKTILVKSTKFRIHLSPLMAGWMEFRVCWWKGWLGRVVNMAAPDVPGPLNLELTTLQPMGGGGGPPSKGGLGWGPDWISNWMEPKSFVVGKTRSGIWFLQFYIQRICTRTEEGLVAKSPLSSAPPFPPTIHPNPASQTNLFQGVSSLTRTIHFQNAQKSLILGS